ncbi:MAG: hypothetical protein IJM92_16785 [Fibrobacter sp.]|uniref:hypothetical protein n=1 Tax=Fibrobacter sp. TaxID=35828 RepID=UPI0025BFB824|nr:hypothetical protein [Fibrobacter sp.]MBQ3714076.1 hypothetical protein [Fibrobacter sp.]MBQ7081278.1 hypothetical protein [Fibrobacter sp.]
MYRISTQKSLDIDWFVNLLDTPIHIASNGGFIPRNTYKIRELEEIYDHIMSKSDDNDVEINESYIESLDGYEYLDNQDFTSVLTENSSVLPSKVTLFSESFVSMAKRGFCSFDRVELISPNGYELYRLIAWPKNTESIIPGWCRNRDIPLVRIIQLLMRENETEHSDDGILNLNIDSKKFISLMRVEEVKDYFNFFGKRVKGK